MGGHAVSGCGALMLDLIQHSIVVPVGILLCCLAWIAAIVILPMRGVQRLISRLKQEELDRVAAAIVRRSPTPGSPHRLRCSASATSCPIATRSRRCASDPSDHRRSCARFCCC